LRASEDSRYVALTMPRVLGRLPYGDRFKKVDEFSFEEDVDGTSLLPAFQLETLPAELPLVTRVGSPGPEGPNSRPAAG
jgi:predicted component of type VI protein secretion system